MTESEILGMVMRWQGRLGLSNWQIAVQFNDRVHTTDGKRVWARAIRSNYFDRATLEFDQCLLDDGDLPDSIETDLINFGATSLDEFVEVTVVHELMHCAMRDLMEAGDLIREDLTRSEASVWDGAWRRAEEKLCEGLAIALVRAMGEVPIRQAAAQAPPVKSRSK